MGLVTFGYLLKNNDIIINVVVVFCMYWEDICFMVCAIESEDNFGEWVLSLHIPWVSVSISGFQSFGEVPFQ